MSNARRPRTPSTVREGVLERLFEDVQASRRIVKRDTILINAIQRALHSDPGNSRRHLEVCVALQDHVA